MILDQKHREALADSEPLLIRPDFEPYLDLKELLPQTSADARAQFRKKFTNYYGLNTGGLTDAFKDRYFEILFSGNMYNDGKPNYAAILTELSEIKRRKGDYAMPFSFVSKLIAIHIETSPVYDRHVAAFFGVIAPPASAPKAERIHWFVNFLADVQSSYIAWAALPQVSEALGKLSHRDSRLAKCHVVRQIDFLVWKVGNQKLLSK